MKYLKQLCDICGTPQPTKNMARHKLRQHGVVATKGRPSKSVFASAGTVEPGQISENGQCENGLELYLSAGNLRMLAPQAKTEKPRSSDENSSRTVTESSAAESSVNGGLVVPENSIPMNETETRCGGIFQTDRRGLNSDSKFNNDTLDYSSANRMTAATMMTSGYKVSTSPQPNSRSSNATATSELKLNL